MTTALEHIRYSCGIAGEEVADYVDELERVVSADSDFISSLRQQLAAEQLNNKLLREALTTCVCAMQDYQAGIGITEMFDKGERLGRKALAQPPDTPALDSFVAEKVKEAVKEADDQILAAKNLLAIMHRDGGHHEFAVGFDQAIQDAMTVYYELTKQRDLAVDVLKTAYEVATNHDDRLPFDWAVYCEMLWQAIKESEAK